MTDVLAFQDVYRTFPPPRRGGIPIRAVEGVSFTVGAGEFVGVVGQSGSGKSTVGRMAAMLDVPTSGTIRLGGKDIGGLRGAELRAARRRVQMVFQDPFDSLDPRQTIFQTVEEPLLAGPGVDRAKRRERVLAVLDQVGLAPAATMAQRYPHQLSGGQRQRVAVARALVLRPELIVADEPVSMLDVSIRAGILRLFKELRRETSAACLFVTHDLAVARYISDRIFVMCQGEIVETGTAEQVINDPRHEYTRLLLSKAPTLDDHTTRAS